MLLAITTLQDLGVYQVHFKSSFLNGDLDKVIFMTQPDGQILTGEKEFVYKLQKSLYGLKQSSRSWYQKLDNFLLENGFWRLELDHNVYINAHAIIAIYMDDVLIFAQGVEVFHWLKKHTL
jgi:hypothetical protein